jgi:hypothetical protein
LDYLIAQHGEPQGVPGCPRGCTSLYGDGLKVSKTYGTVFGMNIHLPTFWGSRGYHSFDPCHQVDDGELLRAIREAGYEDRLIVSKQRVAEGNNIAFSCIFFTYFYLHQFLPFQVLLILLHFLKLRNG